MASRQIEVLISIGSNIDKEKNVPVAIDALRAEPQLCVLAVSQIYETDAVDASGEVSAYLPAFHNAAAKVETQLSPVELRAVLRAIEERMGRVRSADKFASRPIDLDVVWYGDETVSLAGHEIPDNDLQRFSHLALPLADIAQDWIHPNLGMTIGQIAADLGGQQHAGTRRPH